MSPAEVYEKKIEAQIICPQDIKVSVYTDGEILVEYQMDHEEIPRLADKGLVKNTHNIKARGLKAILFRKLGRFDEAEEWLKENLNIDPFDYVSVFETALLKRAAGDGAAEKVTLDRLNRLMRDFHENYLQAARDYAETRACQEAFEILGQCKKSHPMIEYY